MHITLPTEIMNIDGYEIKIEQWIDGSTLDISNLYLIESPYYIAL